MFKLYSKKGESSLFDFTINSHKVYKNKVLRIIVEKSIIMNSQLFPRSAVGMKGSRYNILSHQSKDPET